MCLDEVRLLVRLGLLLGLAELLDQAHGLALEAAVEPPAGTGVDDIAQLFGREVEESIDRSDDVLYGREGRRVGQARRTGRGRFRGS
jgi:hypothetical protein